MLSFNIFTIYFSVGFMTMGMDGFVLQHPSTRKPWNIIRIDDMIPVLEMATWSNGQAVLDYQNFLSTGQQELQLKGDVPSVIVVTGKELDETRKLANVIYGMGEGNDVVVSADMIFPESVGGNYEYPIYVTLPPTELVQFLDQMSATFVERIDDLVFFSGGNNYGNIEDLLKDRGFCRDQMTQVLISGLEITPTFQLNDLAISLGNDANGEVKMAGECSACGKWAGSVASRLGRYNIFCKTEFYREWRRRMWERSIYDAALNLVGAIRDEPTTIADVAKYYSEEVDDIVWDFSQLLRGWKAVTLMYGFEQRILGFADVRGSDTLCSLNDEMFPFVWGNNVYMQSKPFLEYLDYAQREKGLLRKVALPSKKSDFQSMMRKGNLRADGVI